MKMPIFEFKIKQSGREKVQGVGLRPFIISQMLGRGFEHGDAVNPRDGKTVLVRVECVSKKDAADFRCFLVSEIKNEANSIYSLLPKRFKFSALNLHAPNNHIAVPLLALKVPALSLSQTTKGVGAMVAMQSGMAAMHHDLKGEIHGMHKDLLGMHKGLKTEIHGMHKDLLGMHKGLKTEIHGMRHDLKKLPQRIAVALRSN